MVRETSREVWPCLGHGRNEHFATFNRKTVGHQHLPLGPKRLAMRDDGNAVEVLWRRGEAAAHSSVPAFQGLAGARSPCRKLRMMFQPNTRKLTAKSAAPSVERRLRSLHPEAKGYV